MADYQESAIPPWLYTEEGPFSVAASSHGHMFSYYGDFESVQDAIRWFIRFHLGPLQWRTAIVTDTYQQILVGYSWYNEHGPMWMGTARGYAAFAEVHDPMSVAVWERMAIGDDAPVVPEER